MKNHHLNFKMVEIIQMDNIYNYRYVYYTILDKVTNIKYHGLLDIVLNKIVFNIDDEVDLFIPYITFVTTEKEGGKLTIFAEGKFSTTAAPELEKALKEPGSIYDLVLREGDVLNIPKPEYTVKVSGEVMHPVSMAFEKGKSAKYYINHAGGYARKAYKRHAYGVHMNGSVMKLSGRTSRHIEPGTEIIVPSKTGRKGMTPSEVIAMSSSAASLASVIAALVNIVTK